jgi:hypothetical protein
MGETESFEVKGIEHVSIYRAKRDTKDPSGASLGENLRHFCKHCGSYLWAWAPKYAQWIYPFASAIDTPLPTPPERTHIMLEAKPDWVYVPKDSSQHHHFEQYPKEGIEQWHQEHGLLEK